jgi:hypothetical protein
MIVTIAIPVSERRPLTPPINMQRRYKIVDVIVLPSAEK